MTTTMLILAGLCLLICIVLSIPIARGVKDLRALKEHRAPVAKERERPQARTGTHRSGAKENSE